MPFYQVTFHIMHDEDPANDGMKTCWFLANSNDAAIQTVKEDWEATCRLLHGPHVVCRKYEIFYGGVGYTPKVFSMERFYEGFPTNSPKPKEDIVDEYINPREMVQKPEKPIEPSGVGIVGVHFGTKGFQSSPESCGNCGLPLMYNVMAESYFSCSLCSSVDGHKKRQLGLLREIRDLLREIKHKPNYPSQD